MAVKIGKADAAAHEKPILRNIVAQNGDVAMLSHMLTVDNYAVAVGIENCQMKGSSSFSVN